MAYNGWMQFNGIELVNVSRTVQLAQAMGISTVRVPASKVAWIGPALGETDYDDIIEAPWYDSNRPETGEFAGFIPLDFTGLDESTQASAPIEFITDGGHSGKRRASTLAMVGSFVIVALTERGAEYGKQWLDVVLQGSPNRRFCNGVDLTYFAWGDADAPKVHRRDVALTRGTSVTRRRRRECSSSWWVQFTVTAGDPYQYGEPVLVVEDLGGTVSSPFYLDTGTEVMTESLCPVFDYTPIYDPLFPGLAPVPAIPNFYPDGWEIYPGMTFDRYWVEIFPSALVRTTVPRLALTTSSLEARMVRVSIWPRGEDPDIQCNALWTTTVSYIPEEVEMTIDGELRAAYVWDGVSDAVRRAESLIYGDDAAPMNWTTIAARGYLVALDLFSDSDGALAQDVEADLWLIPRSN